MELRVLTHSALSAFKRCRRAYKYSYIDLLRPMSEKKYFLFGTAGHEAINIMETQSLDRAIAFCEDARGLDPYERKTLAALVRGHEWHYAKDRVMPAIREEAFTRPIYNPATGATSKTFLAGGKVDGLVSLPDGRTAILERKFLSESIDEKLWARLLIESQISHYCLCLGCDTVIYDIIRKPAMQPLKATPIESRKYKQDGTLYASQREFDETPEEWGKRLEEDIISRPEFYYGRREIPRISSDLEEYRQELWDTAQDVRETELNGRWYRNVHTYNCNNCSYFNLCAGLTAYDGKSAPEGFTFVSEPNMELL